MPLSTTVIDWVPVNECARSSHFFAWDLEGDRCILCGLLVPQGFMSQLIGAIFGTDPEKVQLTGVFSG